MGIGDAVQYAMTEKVWSEKSHKYGAGFYSFWTGRILTCYPSLRGKVVGIRIGQVCVSWDLIRTVVRLEKDGDGGYHNITATEPYTLTYWHPERFIHGEQS
jgi:hypothetical protein